MVNNRKVKIALLGNSIPLMMLPHRASEGDRTYCEHLEDRGFTLINASKQSAMLSDAYRYFDDEIIRHFPDYLIINMGIVEASRRARPRFMQNYFNENAWKNNVIDIDYCSRSARLARRIAKFFYKYLEKLLYAIGISWRWMPPRHFRHALRDLLITLFRETGVSKAIIIGIMPANEKLETLLPGTKESIESYNKILKSMETLFPKAVYLDLEEVFGKVSLGDMTVDYIHFNARGHEIIADRIESIIKSDLQ